MPRRWVPRRRRSTAAGGHRHDGRRGPGRLHRGRLSGPEREVVLAELHSERFVARLLKLRLGALDTAAQRGHLRVARIGLGSSAGFQAPAAYRCRARGATPSTATNTAPHGAATHRSRRASRMRRPPAGWRAERGRSSRANAVRRTGGPRQPARSEKWKGPAEARPSQTSVRKERAAWLSPTDDATNRPPVCGCGRGIRTLISWVTTRRPTS
jgi:hypothetical protein